MRTTKAIAAGSELIVSSYGPSYWSSVNREIESGCDGFKGLKPQMRNLLKEAEDPTTRSIRKKKNL
jgi:hypothetical protein